MVIFLTVAFEAVTRLMQTRCKAALEQCFTNCGTFTSVGKWAVA
jgi:hypothetical protein